ncbi:hypothetical protein Pmani_018321 [Petrolisthes manimaculis]|uniref:Uncharacterized protein n=1 Tax=Petrolisthes manimaculis TaxID=1843537 RepID=A0AAE1U8G8_9EUCA|nr:hypothetical protein Pmani_018321 [Petrolisthes manimaculis]
MKKKSKRKVGLSTSKCSVEVDPSVVTEKSKLSQHISFHQLPESTKEVIDSDDLFEFIDVTKHCSDYDMLEEERMKVKVEQCNDNCNDHNMLEEERMKVEIEDCSDEKLEEERMKVKVEDCSDEDVIMKVEHDIDEDENSCSLPNPDIKPDEPEPNPNYNDTDNWLKVVTQPETEGDIWSAEPQWKRTEDVSQWAKNVAKKRRDSGLEYISVKKNVAVPAKVVGPALPCSKKCYDRVGVDIVNKIFDKYWKMASHNTQSRYIAKHILSKEVSRRYSGPNSKRNVTYEYFVTVNKKDIVVCKTCFCNIHAISKKRVENMLSKVRSTGVAPVDQRGASASVNKTHEDVLQIVQDHVRSLPTCSSHYSRAKSRHRVYLPPGYGHRKCYDLYKHQCEEKNLGPDKILKRDKEVAEAAKDTSKTSELVTKKRLHLIKTNVAHSIMDAYGYDNDPSLCAIAMDLQQTLVTPRLTTNVAYYKRKMWTYNFGIHNLKENSQAMFLSLCLE